MTQTSSGAPITITTSAGIAVITATAAASGVETGDLSFVISPAAKAQLEQLFKAADAACSAAGKLRRRQADVVGACVVEYMKKNAEEELLRDLAKMLGDFADGAGNLIELVFEGAGAGVTAALTSTGETVGMGIAFTWLAYSLWKESGGDLGGKMPEVVKIPVKNVATKTSLPTSTSSSEQPGQTVPPLLENFYNIEPDTFDSASADALAIGLEARYESLTSAAMAAAATAAPNTCQCYEIVDADGVVQSSDCKNVVTDGQQCDVNTHYPPLRLPYANDYITAHSFHSRPTRAHACSNS